MDLCFDFGRISCAWMFTVTGQESEVERILLDEIQPNPSNPPVHTSEPVTDHFTAQLQITLCFTFVAAHKFKKKKKMLHTQQDCVSHADDFFFFPDSITGISFKDSTGTDAN